MWIFPTQELFLSDRCLTFGLQGHVYPLAICACTLCGPLATPEKYPISVHSPAMFAQDKDFKKCPLPTQCRKTRAKSFVIFYICA